MQELVSTEATTLKATNNERASTKTSRLEHFWLFLFYSIIAIALISPISSSGVIPNLADYINHLAGIIQAKDALLQGQFPLRTMPLEHNGWGYPLYQFYAPTSYAVVGLIYWLITPSDPLIAFQIVILTSLVMGGFFMYRLAYWFIQSKPAAILAGVAYLCAPYYLVIINHLGSLQEIIALGMLPLVLQYTLQRYFQPQNPVILLKLSLVTYLFFTIHLPTAIYALTLFSILLFAITCKNRSRWRSLVSVFIAYAFGCLMAVWFLAPAGLFAKYFLINEVYTDTSYLSRFHPTLSNLLSPAAALTTGFKSSALMTIHPAVGLPIVSAAAICIYALFNKLSSGRKRADYWMPALLMIFFISFLLAWSPINFWRVMPNALMVATHCWRLLAQVIWIGALLFAWAVYWLFKGKLDKKHVIAGTMLIILCANPWFPVAENFKVSLADFIKSPKLLYNAHSLLINYNQYPNFVSRIESIRVDISGNLLTNTEYTVPEPLVNLALKPMITIAGKSPENMQLTAKVNGAAIATKTIKTGEFTWNIPISFAQHKTATKLEFTTKNKSVAKLPVQEFLLTGFLHEGEVMSLKQVAPSCTQQGNKKVCRIDVPVGVSAVELPALYYPQMLRITLNGKEVNYDSTIYQGKLLASIEPVAGTTNIITIEFTGMQWANKMSWLGWGLWLLLLSMCFIKRVYR